MAQSRRGHSVRGLLAKPSIDMIRAFNPHSRQRTMTSTTAPADQTGTRRKLLRQLPRLALLLAAAAVVLLALGPLGWRVGWWHFRFAFFYLMPWAAYCGLAAMALAVIALAVGWRAGRARQVAIGVLAFIIGAAIAYVPWQYDQMRGTLPPIHDITTDWEN